MYGASTTLAGWVSVIHRTLIAHGCDADRILNQAGIDLQDLADPLARIPVSCTTALWRLAVLESGDPAFGISVASRVRANTFQALGLSLAASPTLQDAFLRLSCHLRIITDAGVLRWSLDDQHGQLELAVVGHQNASHESIDAFMSCLVRMCRSLTSPQSAEPVEVHLCRPRPPRTDRFEDAFRCQIQYGAARNVLVFNAHDVTVPLPGGNASLAQLHDGVLAKMLADVDHCNIRHRVGLLLLDLLPKGDVTQSLIALRLDMSMRTLQRRLKAQSTSYECVLDEARLAVAVKLLSEDGHSIKDLALLLGFSDASGFSRFFKRWKGEAPGEFRHRQLRDAVLATNSAS